MTETQKHIAQHVCGGKFDPDKRLDDQVSPHNMSCFAGMIETGKATYNDFEAVGGRVLAAAVGGLVLAAAVAKTIGSPSMSTTATVSDASKLLDVRGVGELLNCSPRHVYRLADSGRMPAPVKLGSLVRWNKASIDEWISTGCKPVRAGKGVRV